MNKLVSPGIVVWPIAALSASMLKEVSGLIVVWFDILVLVLGSRDCYSAVWCSWGS